MADSGNYRIQVFTAEGVFLRMVWGKLDFPVGVTIDSDDMVYVSELLNHRVSVFTSGGQFMMSFGEFRRPFGLAVDTSGVVYVCDFDHCVSLH